MTYAQFAVEKHMCSSGVQALAARNLELLHVIEDTVDSLAADSGLVRSINASYVELLSKITASKTEIDPTARIRATLGKASDSCVRIHYDAKVRHDSAVNDPQLRDYDGVVEAYSEFIDVVRELHDTIEELSEWIAVHDAVLQPTTGATFDTVDSLFDSLLSKK